MSEKTIVVNLVGVLGAGKSTAAYYITAKLKMAGVNVEYVSEYAKDKIWENNTCSLKNQALIFGKQYYKIDRCTDKVDVIVCDSPIILCAYYNKNPVLGENFNHMVVDVFNSFDNETYFVERVNEYNPVGRFALQKDSDNIRKPMLDILKKYKIKYTVIKGEEKSYDMIVKHILGRLNKEKTL